MIVAFGEWLPDLPYLANPGATIAKNVIPHLKSYKPFPSLSTFSGALTAYCRGAFGTTAIGGTSYQYAGDATKLYTLTSSTNNFTDASRLAGGAYTTGTQSYWEFVKFRGTAGEFKVIASNYDDDMQVVTLGGANFALLGGTPPKARHIAVVGDFVVSGNTNDADGVMPNKVRWCAINNETDWTIAASTQADDQILKGNGGAIQNIVGGQEYGIVFQERAIWIMQYVGSPIVFDFKKVEDARGAFCPRGVVSTGNKVFYWGEDGFYMFSGGGSIPIGEGKIDKTVMADLDDAYTYRVTATADPRNKIVMWAYPGSGNVGGTPNKLLIYNWVAQKWSTAEVNTEVVVPSIGLGYTLDGLDAITTNLDLLSESLDSPVWAGGKYQLSAFNSDHKLSHFTGTAMDATLETGEFQPIENKRSEITEVTPIVDGGTHTVTMGTRETQSSTISWGTQTSENTSGKVSVRSNSRYHRIRLQNTGDFTDAVGVEVNKAASVGER